MDTGNLYFKYLNLKTKQILKLRYFWSLCEHFLNVYTLYTVDTGRRYQLSRVSIEESGIYTGGMFLYGTDQDLDFCTDIVILA